MDIFEITHDERFRATHEIGHALIAEKLGVDWSYITIDQADPKAGGLIKHSDLEETEDNFEKIVLLKMAGEAILSRSYGEVMAIASALKDRDDVEDTFKRVLGKDNKFQAKCCCSRAVKANIMYFRKPLVRDLIPKLVEELLRRRTMTREEFLKSQNKLTAS